MVTLDEVARRAGMAKSSVAEILRNDGLRYAEASRDKVRRIANELGYCPNVAARATRQGRSHAYTLLVGTRAEHSFLPLELLIALDDALSDHGCHLVLRHWPDEDAGRGAAAVMRGVMADGFFVNCLYDLPPVLTRIIAKNRLPCVYLNRRDPAPDAVYPDDFGDAVRLTRALIDAGHRRVAYFDPVLPADPHRTHYSKIDRREGYRRAMAEAGLKARVFAATAASEPASRHVDAAASLLQGRNRPTAVVAYGHDAAVATLAAARGAGLAPTADLAVAAFYAYEAVLDADIAFRIHIDWTTLAARAVSRMESRRRGAPPAVDESASGAVPGVLRMG